MRLAYIIGKGPSAHPVSGGYVVGLNHAAFMDCVDVACCADQIMIRQFVASNMTKPLVIGRVPAYRYAHPIIRMKHLYGSSAGLALHYLAGLGYKTVNLVGFDAYEDYLDGIENSETYKYRHVNVSIDRALFDTGITPILGREHNSRPLTAALPKVNNMRTRPVKGGIWLLDATPKNIRLMSETHTGGPRIWIPKPISEPTVDRLDTEPCKSQPLPSPSVCSEL